MGALRARRGLAFSADGRSRASAYNSSARGPSARALGIFAVESALATKGDEIGVAQQPTALAPFFDGRVRRSHLCNRVVIRGLAQPGRGVSFPCTASVLIAAGEPGLRHRQTLTFQARRPAVINAARRPRNVSGGVTSCVSRGPAVRRLKTGHGPKPNVASLSAASEVWIGLPLASKGITVTTVQRS